jgi:hypothetical protein
MERNKQMKSHPYEKLEPSNFWRATVSNHSWNEINFKPNVRFQIAGSEKIITAGSCFAQHIAKNLKNLGFQHHVTELPPNFLSPERAVELQYGIFSARYGNIYTVRQLRQLLEFSFKLKVTEPLIQKDNNKIYDLLRPNLSDSPYESIEEYNCDRRYHFDCVKSAFLEADVFIFTLGLTEYWFDFPSDTVFPVCPGTKFGKFDPDRHKFAVSDYHEIVSDLQWCIDFGKHVNPNLKWIFTVSPVALAATAQDQNIILATCSAKSLLRAVVESAYQKNQHCEYFPSFEITSYVANMGKYLEPDLRNINENGVNHAMQAFKSMFQSGSSVIGNGGEPKIDLNAQIAKLAQTECDEIFNDPKIHKF